MKKIANRLLESLGLQISRIDRPMRSLGAGLGKLSKVVSPTHVVDIGVDYGTPQLYKTFPSKLYKYLLIEADPENIETLKHIASKLDARFENVFCGSQEGNTTLYVADNHAYSSAYAPGRGYTPIDVPVKTLDSITKKEREESSSFLLKIDVEGAEMDILRGAHETLAKTIAVVIEASVAKKFQGGAEFGDIVSFLREEGFSVFDLCAGFDRGGKLYQLDAIFVRTDASFR